MPWREGFALGVGEAEAAGRSGDSGGEEAGNSEVRLHLVRSSPITSLLCHERGCLLVWQAVEQFISLGRCSL